MSYKIPFTYTDEQTLRVELINQEMDTLGLTHEKLTCGFALQSIKEALTFKCTINPQKVIDGIWTELFDNASIEEIQKRNGFNKAYSKADRELCTRICLRLQSPEMRDQNITSASIAKSMGKSAATISQLLNGKYGANPSKHLHDIWGLISPAELEQSKQAEERKYVSIVYGKVPFIPTSTSKLIAMACDQARQRRRFSVFAGQAGLGKTKGINEYCRNNKEAILIAGSEQTQTR